MKTRMKTWLHLVSLMTVALLILAGCGAEATPTAVPVEPNVALGVSA